MPYVHSSGPRTICAIKGCLCGGSSWVQAVLAGDLPRQTSDPLRYSPYGHAAKAAATMFACPLDQQTSRQQHIVHGALVALPEDAHTDPNAAAVNKSGAAPSSCPNLPSHAESRRVGTVTPAVTQHHRSCTQHHPSRTIVQAAYMHGSTHQSVNTHGHTQNFSRVTKPAQPQCAMALCAH